MHIGSMCTDPGQQPWSRWRHGDVWARLTVHVVAGKQLSNMLMLEVTPISIWSQAKGDRYDSLPWLCPTDWA